MKKFYKNKDILVTGGAGSIGRQIVKELTKFNPKRIRVFDQNETAQFFLQQSLKNHPNIRYMIGDIRDKERLAWATKGVDIIFHCAALKHVPSCEYNPEEAIQTNILGLNNMIKIAREQEVEKFVYISTDKAVYPENIMGISKLFGEKLVNNASFGETKTKFASVRFGNVLNSNGSVVPLFKEQISQGGPITITHPEMTRFFMSIQHAARLVLETAKTTKGKETHILKMPALRIIDLARVLSNELSPNKLIPIKSIGIRPGEKLHEKLITEEEAKIVENKKTSFMLKQQVITPHYTRVSTFNSNVKPHEYDSENAKLLNQDQIKSLLKKYNII